MTPQSGNSFTHGNDDLQARHHVSGVNSYFVGEELSLNQYLQQAREMLETFHTRRSGIDVQKTVSGNAPFALQPQDHSFAGKNKKYRRGILLTHGLTDSPYFMRYLGSFFQEQGFRVLAILLPGHGTQPGDLLQVTWHEWLKAVTYGMSKLDEEVDEIYLGGFSAGGALSIYQSLLDKRVRGLFLFSPALKITPRAAFANLHKLYSWCVPSAKWVDIHPDVDAYKYESLAKNGVYQTHRLIRETNSALRRQSVSIPVFAVTSMEDVTVESSATIQFMENVSHPCSRLIVYGANEANKPSGFPAEKLEWVNSALPKQKILSSAHTAIVLPAEDEHYGANGSYSNCLHYYPDEMGKYEMCMRYTHRVLQGEITPENLQAGVVRRLMFNPHFELLKASMLKFIECLP